MLEECAELEQYTVFFQIGEGQYGTVYKALDKKTLEMVAIKVISKQNKSSADLEMFYKEISILLRLKHPHIIQLKQSFETVDNIYIITEYCKCDLLGYAIKRDFLKLEEVRMVALQLLSALKCIHSLGLIHHDIKTQNILVGVDGKLKLCDFGLAISLKNNNEITLINKVKDIYVANINYLHNIKWNVGVVLYELFVGKPPFDGLSAASLKEKITFGNVIWPKQIDNNLKDFLSKLLTVNATMRFSWEDLIFHEFLHSKTIESSLELSKKTF
ncbi:hypothetical protein BB561_003598 [Smittium simulii]|uniref:non-specific serine/threonine protein kinase n=1 Tax=Smittium simulii TaxID=133385 RepID=A0A2T9YKH6_9FUNG|nr:hypothetical protein BB561_003598 [Smittium simulii]